MRYAKWEFHDALYRLGGWYVESLRFVLSAYVAGKINTVDLHDLFYLILVLVLKWSSERRS